MSNLRLQSKETVYNADDLKVRVWDSLGEGLPLVLDASELETADLTCLQTLVAAQRAAQKAGGTIVSADLDGTPLAKAFARAGITAPFDAAAPST
ncbi:STAS domain-containing protein [uncultured Alsobacter sp.]|uniref:STAS domain-containing protein n=1 Tax=uncultured Alsobacter sp. TaxID=1748258 RepID=UPI0025F6C0BC|nr:STAS domain-containing protein [uncultured Alsobacter sp.]